MQDEIPQEVMDTIGEMPPPEVFETMGDDPPPELLETMGELPPELASDEGFSGIHSDKLAAEIGDEVSVGDAFDTTFSGQREFNKRDPGWFEKTISVLTIPEQFMARQTTNVLENLGAVTTEEAKDLLSRDQLHGSDLVNTFWKNPEGTLEKVGRFGAGILAEMIIDPLSYIGIGALTKAGRTAKIGSTVIQDLNKVSKSERLYYKTLEKLDTVVRSDGVIEDVAMKSDLQKTLELSAAFPGKNKQISLETLAEQIKKSATISEGSVDKIIREGMATPKFSDQLAAGERGLTLGINIPFTRTGMEFDFPVLNHLAPVAGAGINAVKQKILAPLGATRGALALRELGTLPYNHMRSLFLKTGKALFDDQTNRWFGAQEMAKVEMNQFLEPYRAYLKQTEKVTQPEVFQGLMDDLIDELEYAPLSVKDALNKASGKAKDGLVEFDIDKFSYLATRGKKDTERLTRLQKHPELLSFVDNWQQINASMVEEYQKRGLPLTELGVGTPGWPRQYLKHMISEDWIDYIKQSNKAGDAMGEAVEYLDKSLGKVDTSTNKRSFRGSINQANEQTMEKLGIKVFVDDPAELMSRRVMEMERVIQNFDLLRAAEPYAIKGRNPGAGWVKVDPTEFKKISLLETGFDNKLSETYKLFVPDAYKQGDVFLPFDVYDRLLFQINGHELTPGVEVMAKAGNAFMNIFRNSALFGPGYLGTNAFSNTLTHVMFNGVDGLKDLGLATKIVSSKVSKDAKSMLGKKQFLSGDNRRLYDEAIEMNLINSDATFEMDFHDLAINMKTSGKAKSWQGKAKTVLDYAYLWNLNRYVSQNTDNIFKLATYMNRRRKGFSPQAAADLSERYFYNYNNLSRSQNIVRNVVPFSTFPMKTMEMVLEEIGAGHLGSLAIPGKVEATLNGEFVEDKKVTAALDEMLPEYTKRIMHPHHGALMPGMRELTMSLPWAGATMDMLFHPESSLHPVLQLLGLAGSANAMNDSTSVESRDQLWADATLGLYRMGLPKWATEYLTAREISDPTIEDQFWTADYRIKEPSMKQLGSMGAAMETLDPLKDASVLQAVNAAEFGKAMDQRYGDSWLYNLLFDGRLEGDQGWVGMKQQALRGEFIRKRIRQMTLGLASMTRLDVDFYYRHFAIKNQVEALTKKLDYKVVEAGQLFDMGKLSELQKNDRFMSMYPEAKEIIALQRKQDALTAYYDWALGIQTNTGDNSIFSLMFGDKDQSVLNEPLKEQPYEQLYLNPEEIDDESAQIMIENRGMQ